MTETEKLIEKLSKFFDPVQVDFTLIEQAADELAHLYTENAELREATMWLRVCSPLPDFKVEESTIGKDGYAYRTTRDKNGRWGVYRGYKLEDLPEPPQKGE